PDALHRHAPEQRTPGIDVHYGTGSGNTVDKAMAARKTENPPSTNPAALAEELRHAIGTFVRAIRKRTATEKSAQSDVLGLLEREGAMNVAALAQRRNVTHQSMRVAAAQL